MDRSAAAPGPTQPPTRRFGRPSHRGRGRATPTGSARSAAILAGDLTYVWADELFERHRARRRRAGTGPAASSPRCATRGHRRPVPRPASWPPTRAPDEDGARHVALLKSARYTVTRPLLLGAALGPSTPDVGVADALPDLRRRGRPRLPAARRRPRPVRRSRRHRQERPRRPARGQAHAAGAAGPATRRRGPAPALLSACLGDPHLDEQRAAVAATGRGRHRRAGVGGGPARRPARCRAGRHRAASPTPPASGARRAGRPRHPAGAA